MALGKLNQMLSRDRMSSTRERAPFTFDAAMRRLTYLMVLGSLVVTIYGVYAAANAAVAVSVSLMISLASALGAGLVGFIFGVPFARDNTGSMPKPTVSQEGSESDVNLSAYRPNTSLEQISDWLTKILVGVGLVEIKQAPTELERLVVWLAPGVGTGRTAEALIASILIFFSVCGFLFGFLWARLYLRRWLTDADRDLIEKLSRFDSDAQATSLVTRQLERREDESSVPPDKLVKALRSASTLAKARFFEQARVASENKDAADYQSIKNPGAATIFNALIADDSQGRYHRNHGELGYTLDRQQPPDLGGSIAALTEAIARRDRLHLSGWRYYEFRRARNRIKQDPGFNAGTSSEPDVVKLVGDDISSARTGDPTKFDKWLQDHSDVRRWIALNSIQV